jgi:predicted ribosome quality control (RQC) complex YloA/Tae2 family protein
MIKNYFILNRLASELDVLLSGFRILSSFSQEKDKMIIEGIKKEERIYIEISVSPQFPFISVKEKFSRGKKNVADLFTGFLPVTVNRVSIANDDRIIRIDSDEGEIYFFIRGNKTNVIMSRGSEYRSFKKAEDEEVISFLNEFRKKEYVGKIDFNIPAETDLSEKEFLKKYPFIGKEILNETISRDTGDIKEALSSVIEDISNNNPVIYTGEDKVKLAVEGFISFRGYQSEKFDNLFSAVNYYISRKHSAEYLSRKKRSLEAGIENELERLASRINNLKGRIDAGTKEEIYNKYANLLLINLDRFEKGSSDVIIEDIYNDNNIIKIKIDPSLSPQKNADKYFEKARSERINYVKSKELYELSIKKYNQLKEEYSRLSEINTQEELRKMDKPYKDSRQQDDKDDLKSKFRQYIIDGKYKLYVGRDSEKNDLLTTRFAKQNDYWFHARGVSGSHVILRVENTKEPVPKSVLKKAAAIAAYHSKAKTASLAPVAYTLKKYVVKKKGMGIGKVALMREEVLLVRPEIPQGCEYISKD